MPIFQDLRNRAKNVMGYMAQLPIINPLITRLFPDLGQPQKYLLLNYTLSSRDLSVGQKFAQTDPRNYVAEILNSLHDTEETITQNSRQFAKDVNRASAMIVKDRDNETSDQTEANANQREIDRNKKIDDFIQHVVSTANAAGKTWVNAAVVRNMINYLQQTSGGFITGMIVTNVQFKNAEDQAIALHFLSRDNNQESPRTVIKYTIEDMKISYTITQYLTIMPEDFDPELHMDRHIRYQVTTSIDFACLANDPLQIMQTSADGITQTLRMDSILPEIKVITSPELTQVIHNSEDDEFIIVDQSASPVPLSNDSNSTPLGSDNESDESDIELGDRENDNIQAQRKNLYMPKFEDSKANSEDATKPNTSDRPKNQ